MMMSSWPVILSIHPILLDSWSMRDTSTISRKIIFSILIKYKKRCFVDIVQCCSVLWYGCSCTTHKWIIEFYQTDNEYEKDWRDNTEQFVTVGTVSSKEEDKANETVFIHPEPSFDETRRDLQDSRVIRLLYESCRCRSLFCWFFILQFLVDEETGIDGIELFISVEDLANNENYTKCTLRLDLVTSQ